MATTKKKTAAKKRPTTRTASKTTAKRPASRGRSSAKTVSMQSFKVAPNVPPFYTFKFTIQTVYWVILLAVVVVAHLFLLDRLNEIAALTETLVTQSQL